MIKLFKFIVGQLRSSGHIVSLSLGISVALILILLFFAEPDQIGLLLRDIRPLTLIFVVLFTLFLYLIVAGRLLVILRLNLIAYARSAVHIITLHAFFLQLLPLRIGDVLYPMLLKKYLGASWSESTANYLVSRLYDLVTAIILLLAAIWVLYGENHELASLRDASSWAVVLIASICILAGIGLRFYRNQPADRSEPEQVGRVSFIRKTRKFVLENLVHIQSVSLTSHVVILALSSIRWLVTAGIFMLLLKAFGVDFGYMHYLLIATGVNLSGIIPLQSIGGIGVVDSVFAAILVLLGVSQSDAVSAALAYRVVWILNIGIITGLLLSYNGLHRRYIS